MSTGKEAVSDQGRVQQLAAAASRIHCYRILEQGIGSAARISDQIAFSSIADDPSPSHGTVFGTTAYGRWIGAHPPG